MLGVSQHQVSVQLWGGDGGGIGSWGQPPVVRSLLEETGVSSLHDEVLPQGAGGSSGSGRLCCG
jgi:hypothetical protein